MTSETGYAQIQASWNILFDVLTVWMLIIVIVPVECGTHPLVRFSDFLYMRAAP